jgi:hypothetical protein
MTRFHFAEAGTVEAFTLKAALVSAYKGILHYRLVRDPDFPNGKLYDLYRWNPLHETWEQIDSIHIKEEPKQMEKGILYIVNNLKETNQNDYCTRNKN